MYYPYLRGKQNELFAIKELLEKGLIGNCIQPIIEPIKYTTTFKNILQYCGEKAFSINLVVNSKLTEEEISNETVEHLTEIITKNKSVIQKAYLGPSDEGNDRLKQQFSSNSLAILTSVDDWEMFGDKNKLEMVFVPDDRHIKRKLRNIPNKGIIMDPFNKLSRNVDYLDNDDEFYSDDHLYYKEDGYVAFSDYSVIGGEYIDGGFSPLAIAIHIVYFDEDNELRVKHFVSDSNNDRLNPAKKFFEAVDKLVTWSKNLDIKNRSYALGQFEELNENNKYPGLGLIKRLSIMHHLEIMNRYLESQNENM
ncbi:hypothetical protein AXE89_07150 [Staphylococcus aureus]|uniref:sce7725 family protein n=1 Tax=Staphylococcus aureus TaxID=1280 RepID=UPI00208E7478|nr:sce7725 family protein [Staphylococcus aureus]MCO4454192.1 hypothetical protein [Staphylococcus aureus]